MFYKRLVVAMQRLYCLSAVAKDDVHWGYDKETGPNNWHCLSPDFKLCASGRKQSPIDIITTRSKKADLPILDFQYNPIPLVIENNGHSIQIITKNAGALVIGDETYKLLQFHAHAPSEEAIDGKRSDMVIHLVHQNAHGQLGVVACLLEVGDTANPLIDTIWEVMPQTQGQPQQHDIQIDIKQLLPTEKEYFTFTGSLTTPPCSEGVKWIVLKQLVSISAAQLEKFKALYPCNARPLQPENNRKILSSN